MSQEVPSFNIRNLTLHHKELVSNQKIKPKHYQLQIKVVAYINLLYSFFSLCHVHFLWQHSNLAADTQYLTYKKVSKSFNTFLI